MRFSYFALAGLATLGVVVAGRAAELQNAGPDRARLIGAWRMVSMEEPGPDGTLTRRTERTGLLSYSTDGHVSVQVMYPVSETADTPYAKAGYEASFGSYDVDEHAHTVTHHVQAANVRSLIGQELPRALQFSPDGHLTLRSTKPEEKWSVTWEHY